MKECQMERDILGGSSELGNYFTYPVYFTLESGKTRKEGIAKA